MKIRVGNFFSEPLRVVLEPWASEYFIAPKDHVDFRAEGPVPESARFDVEYHRDQIVILAEWEGALVYAYGSDGALID